MNKNVRLLLIIPTLFVFGFILFRNLGYAGGNVTNPEGLSLPAASTVSAKYTDTLRFTQSFPGRFQAARNSSLAFEIGGKLAELFVDEGARVVKEQALAQLDVESLQIELSQIDANIAAAEARANLAENTFQRRTRLVSKGHTSKQELDQSRFERDERVATLAALRANRERTLLSIRKSVLRAPYDGTIVKRQMDEGVVIQPGTTIFETREVGDFEFVVGLPPRLAQALKAGQASYSIRFGDKDVIGKLDAVLEVIESGSRSVKARFQIDQNSIAVVDGELGSLELQIQRPERGLWLAQSSLIRGERGLWRVLVAEATDGSGYMISPKAVRILHTDERRVYVTGTVEENDQIITEGAHRFAPGQLVRVKG